MWLKVNNEFRQNSNTANMIFDVPTIVSYVSEYGLNRYAVGDIATVVWT